MSLPSYDELPRRGGARCAWGVWGSDDVLGTLNLLTPDGVLRGRDAVVSGRVFSLNLELGEPAPPLFGRSPGDHEIVRRTEFSRDDVYHAFNTQASTHWDGFRHAEFAGQGPYNGLANEAHGIGHWAARGIAGRGVLADVARWREQVGRPLRPGEPDPITPEDLDATLHAQGVELEPGDVLVLRTGWLEWFGSLDLSERTAITEAPLTELSTVGLAPGEATARWLWDHRISAVAADNPALELYPIGALADEDTRTAARSDPALKYLIDLHQLTLVMLGLPLGELFDVDALARDCAADGRFTFLFTSAPLHRTAGVASPANALAVK